LHCFKLYVIVDAIIELQTYFVDLQFKLYTLLRVTEGLGPMTSSNRLITRC